MKKGKFYFLLILVFLISCSDKVFKSSLSVEKQEQLTPKQRSEYAKAQSQTSEVTRWDTPWWEMSDEQIADSLRATEGEVLISFKEPGEKAGVDEKGRVIVSDQTINFAKAVMIDLGVEIKREYKLHPSVLAKIPVDLKLISNLRNHPLVDIFEPNIKGRWISEITWNTERVKAPDVWDVTTGSGTKLLMIDSGISNNHTDLNPTVIQACDGSDGLDQLGHGTHVSGIAAAVQNGQDVVGVSHNVELWSSKVGTTEPKASYVECAIEFGRSNNVHVMNMSLSITPLSTLTDEINAAYNQDNIVLVAAAGNTSGGAVTYPANLSTVIAVTATDINDDVWTTGAAIGPEIELSAPGVDIESTCLGGGTCLATGTSMAAPHVAGATALLKSYDPACSNSQIRNLLNENAQLISGSSNEVGNGLLDVAAALPAPASAEFEVIDGPGAPSDGWITVSYEQNDVKTNYFAGDDPIRVASRIQSNVNADANIQLTAETPSGAIVVLTEKRRGSEHVGKSVELPNSPDNYLIPDQSSVILRGCRD